MISRPRLLAFLNAALLLAAFGCGDEGGGCGPAPAKKEAAEAPSGGSGKTGSTSSGGDIYIQDKKGRVPKPYQRPSQYTDEKSTKTITAPVIAVSTAAASRRVQIRVTKRKVDGIADRVELKCRIIASSPDGLCSGAANYAEIKESCCPGGLVETCKTSMNGVVLVGRGCEPTPR